MKHLHILICDRESWEKLKKVAAKQSRIKWIVPKQALPGDKAILFFPHQGFFGEGKILSAPTQTFFHKKPAYSSVIGCLLPFPNTIPIKPLKEKFSEWAWIRFPRTYTTVHGTFAEEVLKFLTEFSSQIFSETKSVLEGIEYETKVFRKTRSNRLRLEALIKAGGKCEACGFDYSVLLDGRGISVLQVHHRKQLSLSKTPRLTTVKDLAVLCANCHCLIHANVKKAMPVEKLARYWKKLQVSYPR
jgi:hypothetical protein